MRRDVEGTRPLHNLLDDFGLFFLPVPGVLLGLDLAQRRPHFCNIYNKTLGQSDPPHLLQFPDLLLELVDSSMRPLAQHPLLQQNIAME